MPRLRERFVAFTLLALAIGLLCSCAGATTLRRGSQNRDVFPSQGSLSHSIVQEQRASVLLQGTAFGNKVIFEDGVEAAVCVAAGNDARSTGVWADRMQFLVYGTNVR